MSALDVTGAMVKAANLPHNVQVVQGVGSKTLLQIDHDQWGRSTIELDLPMTAQVWLELRFDDLGRANVSLLNANQLAAAVGAPPAMRASLLDCGDCDTPHPTPGCSDPACEALVCGQDTFCCAVEWDQFCVNMALAKCDCGNGPGDCGNCTPTINDAQVGINGSFQQACEDGQWVSLAFPINTGGANVDTVVSVHNTNTGEGDIYIMGGTCDGPDVNDIYGVCCNGIVGAPSGVPISNAFEDGPFPTSDTDPTWVVMVFRSGFSFDCAHDSTTLGTAGAAYGNLSGAPDPGEWQDLNNYGFGACYWVDLTLTGDPSTCGGGGPSDPPANDDCEDAEALDVAPGGSDCADGTTILATADGVECVTPTTAPGVWYKVIGTGNGMMATTCEDFPPAGADYDTKISVFCGECVAAQSDCCFAHSTPGCDDAACEAIVCAQDSYCCAVQWDSICAGEAATKCGDLCTGGGGGGLICVNGNDDACNTSIFHSTVSWCSQAGAEYYIMVHGYSSGTGNFTICVNDDGVSCPWTVDCGAAPPLGACCQCDDDNVQFCTQETQADCEAMDDPNTPELEAVFLGVDEPCTTGGDALIYESNPNAPIPDGSPVGVSDTMTVTDSLTITDLDVDVVINHTWLGDLCVQLSKAGGPTVTLMKRIGLAAECDATGCCGCSGDNMDVILDDEAADSIEDFCPPPSTGTYSPDPDALSAFDGLDAAGDWTIWVNDNAGADTGTLVQWSLHFEQPGGDPPCAVAYPDQCNTPPDCSGAYASVDELWPPNHKYRGVTIEGVTDVDDDPITITITGIFQDEPVDGLGDGNTCPDGDSVGGVAMVRAERAGGADGRVYHIFFLAEDGEGGACEGSVTVCVPHDQAGDGCVDQGPLYDSTDCGDGGEPGWGN
ncbi:MAG: proprotein convertase P-domain-containing protein [Planctomycetota bacterium]